MRIKPTVVLVIASVLALALTACGEEATKPTQPPPAATPTAAPVPTATPTNAPATVTPAPTSTPEPTATAAQAPTYAPAPSATPTTAPEPTATPTAVPEPTATPVPVSPIDAAFERFNHERQAMGLSAFAAAVEEDDAYIPFHSFDVGCESSVSEYEELMVEDIHAVSMSIIEGVADCGLKVVTYHIVPLEDRMRVEQSVWDCFTDSRDFQEGSDVSCGGRYTFFGRHVRWLPDEVLYTIVEGEGARDKFVSHIPWIEERLGVKVSEAASGQRPHLSLYFGLESPANCPHNYGCNVYMEDETGASADIYVSAPDEFFSQVLKHELLHALLPMGHLPEGNYLMSVRPTDPSQTHTLSPLEEKLLELYTHPYLRADMTMDEFRRYLVIE